jgi:hypothetical protein
LQHVVADMQVIVRPPVVSLAWRSARQAVRSRDRAVLLAALSRILMPTPARSAPGSGLHAMMSSLPQVRSELLEPT